MVVVLYVISVSMNNIMDNDRFDVVFCNFN